ncbi:MAG: hypothetical protein RLZZ429_785 [Bacteroidota bacterium]|jgi:hypothetical protein
MDQTKKILQKCVEVEIRSEKSKVKSEKFSPFTFHYSRGIRSILAFSQEQQFGEEDHE